MWSLAPEKQVSPAQMFQHFNTSRHHLSTYSWKWVWGIGRGVWGTPWITFLHILTSNSETNNTAVNQKSLPPESNNIQKTRIYAHVRDWLQLVRHSKLSDFRAISSITSLFVCVDHHEETLRNLITPVRIWQTIHACIYTYMSRHKHAQEKKDYNAWNFLLYWLNYFFQTG